MAKTTGTLWEHDSTFASLNHGLTSSIFNIICGACFGLIRIDRQNKEIFLNISRVHENATLIIPVEEGQIILINKKGKIEINKPEDYQCVFLHSARI